MKKKAYLRCTSYYDGYSSPDLEGGGFDEDGNCIHSRISSGKSWLRSDLNTDEELKDYELIDEIDSTFDIVFQKYLDENKEQHLIRALNKLNRYERELVKNYYISNLSYGESNY